MALEDEIDVILLELKRYFEVNNNSMCTHICSTQQFKIEQESYDNWNGGQQGYRLTLFLDRNLFYRILENKDSYQQSILEQINKFHDHGDSEHGPNDFIECITLTISKSGAPEKYVPKDIEDRIWETPGIKTFISHRDPHKKEVTEFANQLKNYGFTPFVAHESIKPTLEWEPEIINAMNSMELFVIYHKDDYHSSSYCDQEIGYALAKGIPIVTLFLDRDYRLQGFVTKIQGLKVAGKSSEELAKLVNDKVWEIGNFKDVQLEHIVQSFVESSSFHETRDNILKIIGVTDYLNETTINRLVDAFNANDQIYNYAGNYRQNLISMLDEKSSTHSFNNEKGRFLSQEIPF